jgi:hypothetical protein
MRFGSAKYRVTLKHRQETGQTLDGVTFDPLHMLALQNSAYWNGVANCSKVETGVMLLLHL